MDWEEDEQGGEALQNGIPEATAEETDVEGGIDASELIEAVFGKGDNLLDPTKGPFARKRG